jgi:hypothetical protein
MISKATEKAIEDAVSEAASDDKKNPTSRYNTQKGRNNTAKYGRKAKKKLPSTPKIASDPSAPGKMGGDKTLQMPYKRKISKALGTSELPVGTPVRDGMKPVTGSKGTSENMTKKFAMGGEVRQGDVRDNSKRGKCY